MCFLNYLKYPFVIIHAIWISLDAKDWMTSLISLSIIMAGEVSVLINNNYQGIYTLSMLKLFLSVITL